MKLIAFDTSTEACSVAVQIDGEVLSKHRIVQREHAALLLPMLEELLAEFGVSAQHIDGVVFGQGPGSFTGLRIAAASAQGIALAADCGVYGVSTLHAIAAGCVRLNPTFEACETVQNAVQNSDYIVSAIDARMDQIYANTYRIESAEQVVGIADEVVVDPNDYAWPEVIRSQKASTGATRLWLCGSGAQRYESVFRESLTGCESLTIKLIGDGFPHALDLLRLADTQNPSLWKSADQAQPVYLRNKVALTEAERSNA